MEGWRQRRIGSIRVNRTHLGIETPSLTLTGLLMEEESERKYAVPKLSPSSVDLGLKEAVNCH